MSLIEHAKEELKRINFGDEDSKVMLQLLELFLNQWDSGGAVSAVAPVFQRLLAYKPLSPLTGEDDEWCIHDAPGCYAQNRRDGMVFKEKDGSAYSIASGKRVAITFPYWPEDDRIKPPVFVVG